MPRHRLGVGGGRAVAVASDARAQPGAAAPAARVPASDRHAAVADAIPRAGAAAVRGDAESDEEETDEAKASTPSEHVSAASSPSLDAAWKEFQANDGEKPTTADEDEEVDAVPPIFFLQIFAKINLKN